MKTAKTLFTALLMSASVAGFCQTELKGEGVSDGNYQAPKASKIVIDGNGNEKDWQKAQWKEVKYTWLGDDVKKEDFQGRYKLLWDADHLYFLVEVYDDSLSDQEKDPFVNWWEDDCLELFIDEDRSKGGHQFSYNAFAYHITLDYDAIDLGPDKQPKNFKDHLQVKRTKKGNVYTWEVAMKVFNDKFTGSGKDVPVKLNEGKVMGFAVSYNDNDGDNRRENFIGSILIPGEGDDRNRGWIDAGVFGEVKLVK
jgi:hypothetical protein